MQCTAADRDISWKMQFSMLHVIANELIVLVIKSADDESACKAHKMGHTKVRNRLKNQRVHMLLYTYIYLLLHNNCPVDALDFILKYIENEEIDNGSTVDEDTAMNDQILHQ